MTVMIDLNVLLDVIQKREPHFGPSATVVSKVLNGELSALLPNHALTTIYYIVAKFADRRRAEEAIDWLLAHFEISVADKSSFVRARSLQMSDFEDAVVTSLAETSGCDYIITRNTSDVENSPVPAVTPEEFLGSLENN
jgi:predicted nucleic acid-binding protein